MSSRLLSTSANVPKTVSTAADGFGGSFHVTSEPCPCGHRGDSLVVLLYFGHMTVARLPDNFKWEADKIQWRGLDPEPREKRMKFLRDPTVRLSAAELGYCVGIDLETVNNWIRRGIISRASIGGRQLRHRLFSVEEVYKTALKSELVKLESLRPPGATPSTISGGNGIRRNCRRERDTMLC